MSLESLKTLPSSNSNLELDVRNETCFAFTAHFNLFRPNAQALGSKTGNGGRAVCEK